MEEYIRRLWDWSVFVVIAPLIVYPIDVILTQYQVTKITDPSIGILQLIKNTMNKQGIGGFYKGFLANLPIYPTMFICDFRTVLCLLERYCESPILTSWIISTLLNPLSVIKIRQQTEVLKNSKDRSHWQLIKDIYQHEGIMGFFKGLFPNYINNLRFFMVLVIHRAFVGLYYEELSVIFGCIVASIIFYPFDLICTNQRNGSKELINEKNTRKYNQIGRINAIFGYYRGVILYVIRNLLKNTIMPILLFTFVQSRMMKKQLWVD